MLARWITLLIAFALVAGSGRMASGQDDDPLPPGAKLRLGTLRLRDLNNWAGAGLTPDGTRLLAFSISGVTRHDIASGRPVEKASPLPATGIGTRAVLSRDGRRAASANYAGAIVWETATGNTLVKVDRRVPTGDGNVALSADGQTLAIGGQRDDPNKPGPVTVIVWDVAANAKRAEVAVLQNQSANVALTADGTILATWGFHSEPNPAGTRPDPATDVGRIVQFWEVATGQELGRARLDGFGPPVVVFAPDGRLAALSSGNGMIQLVAPRGGGLQRQLFGRAGMGARLAFAPDGARLASAATDGAVQLWRVADGYPLAIVESPVPVLPGGVREIRFTANDRAVVFAVFESAAFVWEVPSGRLLTPTGGHFSRVSGLVFTGDGKEILSGSLDGAIFRWNAANGKFLGEIALRTGSALPVRLAVAPVTFAPGGTVAITDRGTRAAYDLATGSQLFTIPSGYETRALLAADARTLVTVPSLPFGQEPPKTLPLIVWDVATGTRLTQQDVPTGELLAVSVSPDRKLLVTAFAIRGGKDAKTELVFTGWNLAAAGQKLGQLTVPGGFGSTWLTAAPDSQTALASLPDGRLMAFDAIQGKLLREIDTNRQTVTAAPVFSPDGKQVAVGLGGNFAISSGGARLYDAATGKLLRTVAGHLGGVTCLAFAPDGRTLATGSVDTTIILWNIADG